MTKTDLNNWIMPKKKDFIRLRRFATKVLRIADRNFSILPNMMREIKQLVKITPSRKLTISIENTYIQLTGF
jgi:hypothetical protein